jgi:hypothetical protein
MGFGACRLPLIYPKVSDGLAGWLAYGVVVRKIFEGAKIWIAEKICRPGFRYG